MSYADLPPQQEFLYLEHAAQAADGAEEQLWERMAEAKDRSDLRRLGVTREVMDLVVDDMTTNAEDWANVGEGNYLVDRPEDSCIEMPPLHTAFINQARQLYTVRVLLAKAFQGPEPPIA